jgi:hypothetical protein
LPKKITLNSLEDVFGGSKDKEEIEWNGLQDSFEESKPTSYVQENEKSSYQAFF